MRKRITNKTDEPIIIESGESLEIIGEEEKHRVLASRKSELLVEETKRK